MRLQAAVAMIVLTLAAGARSASAQSPSKDADADRITRTALGITYATTLAVQLYDARTTLKAIHAGAHETNPLVMPFSSSPGVIVATSLARAAAIDLGLQSLAARNRVAAIAVGAGVNWAYLAIAVHNRTVADQMRAQAARR